MPILVGLSTAAFVFLAAPSRPQNKRLAGLLFLENAGGACGSLLLYSTTSAATAYALQTVAYANFLPFTVAYLLFLAVLPTRLVRPLKPRWVQGLLVLLAVLYVIVVLWQTELFLIGVGPTDYARYESIDGPALSWAVWVGIWAWLFALVAAVGMWREAPKGSQRRRQGAIYAVAFGVRDLGWMGFLVGLFILPRVAETFLVALLPVTNTIFYAVLAYGILSTQLLDIDLRVKWTVKQSTIALVFVAVFLAATEGAQVVFGADNPWLGIAAAVLLVFLLAPLQRFAERVSDAAMPGVEDTEAYRTVRKREIYRAAVESALVDGRITDKERDVLATLADHLALSAGDARTLERDVLARAQGVA